MNHDKEIVGIITAQDVVEAVDDEMGEDYAKLAGLTAEEDLQETTKQSIKKTFAVACCASCFGYGSFGCCRCI